MAEKKEDSLLDIGFRLLSVAILFWSVERSQASALCIRYSLYIHL